MTLFLIRLSVEDRLAVSEEGSNGSPRPSWVPHLSHLRPFLQCRLWSNPLRHLRRGIITISCECIIISCVVFSSPRLFCYSTKLSGLELL